MLENQTQISFINDDASKARKKLVVFSIACVLVAVFGLDQASILSQSFTPKRNETLLPYVGVAVILWLKFEFMSKFLDYNSAIDTLLRSKALKVNGSVLSLSVYFKSLSHDIKSRLRSEYYASAQEQKIETLSKLDPSNSQVFKVSLHPQVMHNTASHYSVNAQIFSERKASIYFIEYTFPMLLGWAGIASMCYMAFW